MNRNVIHSEEYLEENGPFRILFLQISENYLKLVFVLFSMHLFQEEQTSGKTDLEQFLSTNLPSDPVGEKD